MSTIRHRLEVSPFVDEAWAVLEGDSGYAAAAAPKKSMSSWLTRSASS